MSKNMEEMPKEEFGTPGVIAHGPHPYKEIGGQQIIFRWKSGYGLSCINAPKLHYYPFSWEIAILKFKKNTKNSLDFTIDYSSDLTDDVAVFITVEETREFVQKAYRLLSGEVEK